VLIGIVGNKDTYLGIAKGLMDLGYQVLKITNTNNMKDPEVHKTSMLHKASFCNVLIADPDDGNLADAIIQQAVYNNQIVLLDSMEKVEDTIAHVRKEIIHA
jgi:hypothetical protein